MTLFDREPADIDATLDDFDDVPRKQARFSKPDVTDTLAVILLGAAGSLLLRQLFDWHGIMAFAVWWYILSILGFFVLQRAGRSTEAGVDRVVTALVWTAGLAVIGVLGWMVIYIALKGYHRLSPSFFTTDMKHTGPLNPGGGVKAAIIGTGEQVGLATVVVVPVAVMTAIYLHEIKGRLATVVAFAINSLAGLPSIVAGLIVYTVWVIHHGFSGVAGSASLGILMLPIVTRTTQEVLQIVPDSLREASLALGAPLWKVVSRVVVPTAISGITTAVLLGMALAIGETAPLLLTVGYSPATNTNAFHAPQSSLTVFIDTYVLEPNANQNARGFTGALILLILVLVLFILARYFAGRSLRKLGGSR